MIFRTIATFLVICFIPGLVIACQMPVYRYALENWREDPLVLVVPEADLEKAQKQLKDAEDAFSLSVLSKGDLEVEPGWYIDDLREPILPWSGKSKSDLEQIFDENCKELSQRLLAGDSMVICVVGPDAESRKPVVELAERRLGQAAKVLRLREDVVESWQSLQTMWKDAEDPVREISFMRRSDIKSLVPMGIAFSILEVPEESGLGRQLRLVHGTKEHEIFAAAAFGRGRALALGGASEIDAGLLDELILFIMGICSCTVKDMNPGTDLYLGVNWDKEVLFRTTKDPAVKIDYPRISGQILDPKSDTIEAIIARKAKEGTKKVEREKGTGKEIKTVLSEEMQ